MALPFNTSEEILAMGDATAREYYAAIHGVVQNFSSLPKVHHKNKATKL